MEYLERIVVELPLCKDLEPCGVDLLVRCASNVRFYAGWNLFREAGAINQFDLIGEGKAAFACHTACDIFAPSAGPFIKGDTYHGTRHSHHQ